MRVQRGSVAMSACGDRPSVMPTARYSRRTMSPSRSVRRVSWAAAMPMASGMAVVPAPATVWPSTTENPLRGSVEITAGMPRRCFSAIACTLLLAAATFSGDFDRRVMAVVTWRSPTSWAVAAAS